MLNYNIALDKATPGCSPLVFEIPKSLGVLDEDAVAGLTWKSFPTMGDLGRLPPGLDG